MTFYLVLAQPQVGNLDATLILEYMSLNSVENGIVDQHVKNY